MLGVKDAQLGGVNSARVDTSTTLQLIICMSAIRLVQHIYPTSLINSLVHNVLRIVSLVTQLNVWFVRNPIIDMDNFVFCCALLPLLFPVDHVRNPIPFHPNPKIKQIHKYQSNLNLL